jgi:sporulation-control protein
MVFKRLKASLGSGVSVDTVLTNPNVLPGGELAGEVRFTGGSVDYAVEGITLTLVALVEVESGDSEYRSNEPFFRAPVAGRFQLAAGASHAVPFRFNVPWETPITALYGQHLHGMSLHVRTELELAGALDKDDSDPFHVHPLPAQQRILDAFGRLGFRFHGADLEKGGIPGSSMPFYQEIEFYPGGQYTHAIKELELTFIAGPTSLDVIMELDKRGGFLTAGGDAYNRFRVDYAAVDQEDWEGWLQQRLSALTSRRW